MIPHNWTSSLLSNEHLMSASTYTSLATRLLTILLFCGTTYGQSTADALGGGGVASGASASAIEACCQVLRLATDQTDKRPVQLTDYGGFNYLLSNSIREGATYGSLTKSHPSGGQVWRYETDSPTELTGFTVTNEGEFLIVGKSVTGGVEDALIIKVQTDGAVDWIRKYGRAGDDEFTSIVRNPNSNSTNNYYLLSSESRSGGQTQGGAIASVYRSTDDIQFPSGSYQMRYPSVSLASGGSSTEQLWRKIVALPNDQSIIVGQSIQPDSRGILLKIDAEGQSLGGIAASLGTKYIDAINVADTLVVVAGYQTDNATGVPRDVSTLWVMPTDFATYHKISWPRDEVQEITSITHGRVQGNTMIFVGAISSEGRAIVIRLEIQLSPDVQSIGSDPEDTSKTTAKKQVSDPNFSYNPYFVSNTSISYSVDITANEVSDVQLQTARNGQYLLYAHARRSAAESNLNLYYGRLSFDFSEPCLRRVFLNPMTSDFGSLTKISAQATSTSLPNPDNSLGWGSRPISAIQRCSPDSIDGCREAYPIPTQGYFRLVPSADCAGKELTLEVLDAYGRVLSTRSTTGTDAVTIDITDSPRGTYIVRWKDQTGRVLHTASVLLT